MALDVFLMKKLKMDNKRWMILFAVLALMVTAFIWGNSLKSNEASREQSKTLTESIKPTVDPDNKIDDFDIEIFLRKSAHILEFFALGFCVAGFTVNLGRLKEERYLSLPLLIVLLVAVIDEYIQHFTQRGTAVTDVVLDFGGAVLGLALVALFCLLRKKWSCKA